MKRSKTTATVAESPTPPLEQPGDLIVRPVRAGDLARIVVIDAEITGIEKAEYWSERFHRYGARGQQPRFFLVAEHAGDIIGFIIGEVRDWEFGTPPCGWVFGISVHPGARLSGIGTRLLEALCASFRQAGVSKVRTLLVFNDLLVMKFYRSQGMMAAPIVTLERELG
jgi:GNAT superfamily N-acetyltransferase